MRFAAVPSKATTAARRGFRPQRQGTNRRTWKTAYRQDARSGLDAGLEFQDDFYSILGVEPTADAKDIKRAYYGMMKECHPDLSYDDESTEFCMLLNDIYETLIDPTKRAVYDDLTGFSTEGINPFREGGVPATKVFVDEYTCIGCRNCSCTATNTFEIEEEYGRARATTQDGDPVEKIQEAIETCPVSCIHWVSDRQLPWLQQAMSSMPRAAVWAMMSGSGSGVDVFSEAERSWERRRADVEAAIEADKWGAFWAANGQVSFNGFWGGSKSSKQQQAEREQQQKEQQAARAGSTRISDLATRAAAASKRWRAAQAAKPKQELYVVY